MVDAATLTRVDLSHRQQQVALASRVARLIAGYWTTVEPDRLAATGTTWLTQSIAAIQAGRRTSALLAGAYAETVHQLQVPRSPRLQIPQIIDAPLEQLRDSLVYTGLGYAAVNLAKAPTPSEAAPGATDEEIQRAVNDTLGREAITRSVMDQALANAARAAVKHVVNGARDVTDGLVVTKVAVGYVRVTQSEKPCGFCLALASRGPVYEDDSFDESDPRFTGPGDHKVHDGCACTLRPVFTRGEENWPEQARSASEFWALHGTAKDGRSAMENFRREARLAGIADLNRW